MKRLLALFLALTSLSAFAMNEVDCDGQNSDQNQVRFQIDQGWGSSIRDARLWVYDTPGSEPEETLYRMWNIQGRNNRIIYSGSDGIRLDVELFPDRVPRWGRRYRATLSVRSDRVGILSCRFPQVRPEPSQD